MKKIKYLMLIMSTLLLTGCVKFNASMEVKKNKSMDFSIIYAFDTSIFGESSVLDEEDKKSIEEQGFKVNDYSDGKMKGFSLVKKIDNIDKISTTTNSEYDLSGLLSDKKDNNYIFTIKKGFFKNSYKAKFKFDASESNLNNSEEEMNDEFKIEENEIVENEEFNDNDLEINEEDNIVEFEEDEDLNLEENEEESMPDFSNAMANLDLSFKVKLPYSAKSNNANQTNNKNKELTWNLSSNEKEFIEFEFELYNTTNILIVCGVGIVLIAVVVVFVIKKKKDNNLTVNIDSNTELNN